MNAPLVLASGSPRRKEILENLGLQFSVHVADVDESVRDGESPLVYATRTAQDKALAVGLRGGCPIGILG